MEYKRILNIHESIFSAQERYEIYRQEHHILVFSKILGVYQVFSVYAVRIFFREEIEGNVPFVAR